MSIDRVKRRERRKLRVRFKLKTINLISNTKSDNPKPRLSVFRSNKHVYAQIIDDSKSITLVSASTLEKNFNNDAKKISEKATQVGINIGKRAAEKGIKEVIFDRGAYKFHGIIANLMKAAQENLSNI